MLCINLLSKRRGYLYKVSKVQWAYLGRTTLSVLSSERTDPHPDSRVATAVSRVRLCRLASAETECRRVRCDRARGASHARRLD